MAFNFDEMINRKNTDSMKWDLLEEKFGYSDLLPMWVADMDFKAPQPILDDLKKQIDHGVFGYPKPSPKIASSIRTWMEKRHQWEIEDQWVSYTPGVVPALATAIHAFTDVGDNILIQTPVYYPFYQVIEKNERNVVRNELINNDGYYEINFADFEEKIKNNNVKMFILCNPHNPVSRVFTEEELTRLGEICLKYNVLIISDEIHSDLIFEGSKHIPIASLSDALLKQTLTCIAPSKTFNLAGLQAAAIIIPNKQLQRTFKSQMDKQGLTMINTLGLTSMGVAYEKGEEWLEALLVYIQENVNVLTRYFEDNLPELRVTKPEGTYLVWIDCRKLGLTKKQLEKMMLEYGKVAFNQGYIFGEEGDGFIRINVACPRELLEDGLARIKTSVDMLKSQEK